VASAPLRQDVAVTGSVNQHGQVQPVGGVTEKIEGFFDFCRAKGFTGTQGVFIPASNRRHLMLRDDVVEAVANGQFHVWLGEEVDDALQLLSGMGADDVHRAVAGRMAEYAESLKAAAGDGEQRPVDGAKSPARP
jgi:predicted ATP-dependent protease